MSEHKVVLTDADAKSMREKLGTLSESSCKVQLALAELLTKVYYGVVKHNNQETPVVQIWGFDDFDTFAETSIREGGLDMHQTSARGLVLLYEELFMNRDFPADTLPNSITKLRQLAKVSKKAKDSRTMLSWVAKAHAMTCCEFEEAVDEAFGTGNKLRSFRFGLKPSQYTVFTKRLSTARESLGGATRAETMLKVLEDWTAMQGVDRVRTKVRA